MFLAVTIDQFGKALVASGLLNAEEVKALWNAIPAGERPKDGDGFAQLLVKQERLSKFQAQELLSGSGTPLVLNQYVLLSKIGAGGMGQVFKAQHRKMKRLAAIKLLPSALTKDEGAVKRFQREVEAAAKLTHPNIVQTYDADECRGIHYMVMECVDGQDLSALVKQNGPLPIADAVDYVLQAARGLAFAHAEGVVHRDIKPANLLLDKKGVVKILDMGLARIDDGNTADHQLTNTGTVMGTVDYMPPEQANDTRKADARSDVYSLGCSLYRMLTGECVFGGETVVQKIMAHMGDPIPSLLTKRPDCPAEIDRIFQKMLAKRPDDRYQQAAQVVAELEAWRNPGAATSFSGSTAASQDANLNDFFRSVGGAKPASSPSSAAVKTATKHTVIGAPEQTAAYSGAELQTDPKSQIVPSSVSSAKPSPTATKPKTGGKGGKKPPVKLIASGFLGAVILLVAGIIVTIKNKDGEIVAEMNVPSGATVEIKTAAVANSAAQMPNPASSTTANIAPELSGAQLAALLDSPDYVWGPPENLGSVNSSDSDRFAGISADELSLFLVRRNTQLMVSKRDNVGLPFPAAQPAPDSKELGIASGDATISSDGLTCAVLRFSQKREIWWGERRSASEPFSKLRQLPPSEGTQTSHAAISPDGLTILANAGGGDIFMWTRPAFGRPYSDAQRLPSPISTPEWDMPCYISNDRQLVILMSQTGDGSNVVRRIRYHSRSDVNLPFDSGKPLDIPLGPAAGSDKNSGFRLSRDGQRIYFTSATYPGGLGDIDIWVTRRLPKSPLVKPSGSQLPPAVVYLDDLQEVEWSGHKALGKHNLEYNGWKYTWRGQEPVHALSTHPRSNETAKARYRIDARYGTFSAAVGLADAVKDSAQSPLVFRVLGDGRELWKSPSIKNVADSASFSISVAGMRELQLEVNCPGDNFNAHAIWHNPRLTPVGPAAAAVVPPLAQAPFDAAQAKAHQEAWAKHLGTEVETTNSVGMKLVLIPPGEFLMGSTDEQVEAALKVADEIITDQPTKDRIQKNERPQHKVVITKPLLMSATEVTIGQFKKFSATGYQTEAEKAALPVVEAGQLTPKPFPTYLNPGYAVTDDSPATAITWNDAVAYCQWLSNQEKTTYRLPTEAEWEYACRAGTTTQYSFGDDHQQLDQYAWYTKNADRKSHPVGRKLPNGFGLFDMHGNLYEWCGDYFAANWYTASPLNDPNGPSVPSDRVIRGGRWNLDAPLGRSASRHFLSPSKSLTSLGFRVVRTFGAPASTASVTPQPAVAQEVIYLDDLAETSSYGSFLAWAGTQPFVRAWKEGVFRGTGEPPAHGLILHPRKDDVGRIVYDLGGRYTSFKATVRCGHNRSAPLFIEVVGDDRSLIRSVNLTTVKEAGFPLVVDVRGVRELKIVVDALRVTTASPLAMIDPQLTPLDGSLNTASPSASAKLFMHDPAFPQWMKDVQTMSAEQQIEAVSKKLMELNPGFDGAIQNPYGGKNPRIENGEVVAVWVQCDHVQDISPVRVFSGLKNLSCWSSSPTISKLSDISPLQELQLRQFNGSYTKISDLTPFQEMPLEILDLRETRIRNLSSLRGMPLRNLSIQLTKIENLTPLEDCKTLENLELYYINVPPSSIAALQKALPNCKIKWDDPAKATTPKPAASGTK